MLESSQEDGQVLIRLKDDESLGRELRTLLRTEKYIRTKDDGTLPPATKRIHRDLANENRRRREQLIRLLGDMLANANHFVAGQRLDVEAGAPQAALSEAMEYLIQNTFNKMGFLETLRDEPLKEIQAVLLSNDIGQYILGDMPEINPQAIEDLRSYIELCRKTSRQIVLFEMVTARYANRPYGWPEFEVVILLTRLAMAGEVQCVSGGAVIPKDKLYEALTTRSKWRSVTVVYRVTSKPEDVKMARELGRDVFSEMGPEGEDALFEFLKRRLAGWHGKLNQYRALADAGNYPGAKDIANGLSLISTLVVRDDTQKFLMQFNDRKSDLLDLVDMFHDIEDFYEHQRPIWDKLRSAASRFKLNQMELERDDFAGPALRRMGEILSTPNPYGLLKEADGIISTVNDINENLLSVWRTKALATITEQTDIVSAEVSNGARG